METDNNLTNYIKSTISHWVGKNFGSQEVDDPSWDIEALSSYLAKELTKRDIKQANLVPHELTILLRTDSNEAHEIAKVNEKINQFGGMVLKVENEGKKRLAYRVQDEDYAIYCYLDIAIPRDAPVKLSSWLNVDDGVLRYLLVRKDNRR